MLGEGVNEAAGFTTADVNKRASVLSGMENRLVLSVKSQVPLNSVGFSMFSSALFT